MNENLVNNEFLVTLSFCDALKSLQNEKEIIDLALRCKNYPTSTTYLEEVLRDSFLVKFLSFNSREKVQKFFSEDLYRPASIFELIPLLVQFPKLRQFKLAAIGSYVSVEFGDHFHLVQMGSLGSEDFYLSTLCFSKCCFENSDHKDFYILGLKK